ncbi:hypothetical protein F1880_004929 [Penicillium rolfsii]|nr:hypothetical protein F1880_004929 [Penicillium rolfsii]
MPKRIPTTIRPSLRLQVTKKYSTEWKLPTSSGQASSIFTSSPFTPHIPKTAELSAPAPAPAPEMGVMNGETPLTVVGHPTTGALSHAALPSLHALA